MKKSVLLITLPALLLSSCAGENSLYGQKLSYSGWYNDLDEETTAGTTVKNYLTENINNIKWDECSHQFADTSSADKVIKEMDENSTAFLKSNYGSWTFNFSKKEEHKCTYFDGEKETIYQATSPTSPETDLVLSLKDDKGEECFEVRATKAENGKIYRSEVSYVNFLYASIVCSVTYNFVLKEESRGFNGFKVIYFANFTN